MMTGSVQRAVRSKRRGLAAMELVLTLPILFIVLLALIEFGMLFFARGDVVEASRLGARAGTMSGASIDSVDASVRAALGSRLGSTAELRIELGERSGDPVLVGVGVPMAAAAPNLLWPIGFNLTGQSLYAETRMIKE